MRAVLLVLLTLAACAPTPPPQPSGPWEQLNIGKWTFNENDLKALPQ